MRTAVAEVCSFRREWVKGLREDVAMEAIRKTLKEVGVDRVFAPGRLRRQWLAAAYERLVPIRRFACGQRPQNNDDHKVREECLWA